MPDRPFTYAHGRGRELALRARARAVALIGRGEGDPQAGIAGGRARELLARFEVAGEFFGDGGVVLDARPEFDSPTLLEELLLELRGEPTLRRCGPAREDVVSGEPVLCSGVAVLRLAEGGTALAAMQLLEQHGLHARIWPLLWAAGAFAWDPGEIDDEVLFATAGMLAAESNVDVCYPIVLYPNDPQGCFPQQWHLARTTLEDRLVDTGANVAAAWHLSRGDGVVLALIDPEEIDTSHEEFGEAGKVVHPQDVTPFPEDGRPETTGVVPGGDHGTFCAGIAVANGDHGASGVAPGAHLLPVRCASALGGLAEAQAIWWAVTHGADVVACPWGPPSLPRDVSYPLPPHTQWALDFAIRVGRGGLGAVVLFSAGNRSSTMDTNGYAAHENVISVGACGADGLRISSSDKGERLWCVFPSGGPALKIWSTIPMESGPDSPYDWRNGGTSAAVSGAAGVAALVLAANPWLQWWDVRAVLAEACDRIGPAESYVAGHSTEFGHGRVNALAAVQIAMRRRATAPTP